MENPALFRLSVIIPARTTRSQVIRSVESVFQSADPIGTEVVVVALNEESGEIEQLRRQFASELASGRLKLAIIDLENRLLTNLRTEGINRSQGVFLTFLEPGDRFHADRLPKLVEYLDGHDFVAEIEETAQDAQWNPKLIPHSFVIRRTLLEEIGGLRIGLFSSDFDVWARARVWLEKQGRFNRIVLMKGRTLIDDRHAALAPYAVSPAVREGANQVKELGTLLRIAPKLSFGELPQLFAEIRNRSFRLFKGKK